MTKDNETLKKNIKAKFKKYHGYELNLDNPKTLSEKIQWMKIYGNLQRYSKYVDKYLVRDFVRDRIGEQYLVPLIGVYYNVNDINFESLPERFIMKANHGCGWNIVVKDKSMVNWKIEKEKMQQWLKSDFSKTGQNNYKGIKPCIIIEELLQDNLNNFIRDYRIFCFHGKPHHIQVSEMRGKGNDLHAFYDLNWNKLEIKYGKKKTFSENIKNPKHLNEMISLAEKLSQDFPFVRVDFYYINNQIFFGELTFTPVNGFRPYKPLSFNKMLGDLLDLDKFNEK